MAYISCGLEHLLTMWCGVLIIIKCWDLIFVFPLILRLWWETSELLSNMFILNYQIFHTTGNSSVDCKRTAVETGRTSLGILSPPRRRCKSLAMLRSTSVGWSAYLRSNAIVLMMLDSTMLNLGHNITLLAVRRSPFLLEHIFQTAMNPGASLLPWTMSHMFAHPSVLAKWAAARWLVGLASS